MKTITINAIDPNDNGVRPNEVLVPRIIGWYTRNRHYVECRADAKNAYWSPYEGPTTIVSIDSGAEYEIAESLESFSRRMGELVDASPIFEFQGVPPADIERVDSEIALAEVIYDGARAISDRAIGVQDITDRLRNFQKEHCRNSHYGECLS